MSNENPPLNGHPQAIPPSANPMQVYGGDGLDDFPVLKAFQQYVDQEQTKAHRRVMSICIFFSVILTLVVAFFLFLLFNLRNQHDSTDLADAYREILETNSRLQRQMHEQTVGNYEQQIKLLQQQRAGSTAGDLALQQQNLELQKKLATLEIEQRLRNEAAAKAQAEAAAEKDGRQTEFQRAETRLKEREARLAEAEKRLHEAEVELHRRRLYPEHYSRLDAQSAPAAAPAPAKPAKAATAAVPAARPEAEADPDDIDDLDDFLQSVDAVAPAAAKPKPAVQKKPAAGKPPAVVPGVMQPDGTIRYFDEEEEPETPPPARNNRNSPTKNWDLPLE